MSIALSFLGWILIALLALLVAAMLMPVRLELSLHKDVVWRGTAAVRPFGRFGPRIVLRRGKAANKTGKSDRKPGKKRAWRRRLKLRGMQVATAFLRLVSDILRKTRIATARLDVQFGLGDPAETGQVYGFLAPVIHGLHAMKTVSVTARPVFDRACLSGKAELDLSLVPAALLAPAARFGWTMLRPTR